MPRNKVLEKAKVTPPSGRNPFDLSFTFADTALAGELNVCLAKPVIAGTKGKITRQCFTRTAQVIAPAFHRITEHFDFYLVPIHSLWRMWNDWKVNINDFKDTNLCPWDSNNSSPDLALPSYAPRVDMKNLAENIFVPASNPDWVDARKANDCLKLAENFGYGDVVCQAAGSGVVNRVMNLFKPAAYQKVYFEHYRNSAYESNNPYAYNFDWLYDGTKQGLFNVNTAKDAAILRELFTMRRVNYRNDYFHNVYPSINYVKSGPNGLQWSIPSDVGQLNSFYYNVTGRYSNPFVASDGTVLTGASQNANVSGNNSSLGPSVQAIRAAFALDKLMRASAYAPKHVKEQWKALYGVDTVEDKDMVSQRICSFQSDVVFQEVTNMALSSQASLGQLGAKAQGGESKDKYYDFYAKEDSILIGVHYFLPRLMYDAIGLDMWNSRLGRADFFNKFLQNLGLRPFVMDAIQGNLTSTYSGLVLGWTVPDAELKISKDENYHAFKRTFKQYEFVEASGTDPASVFINVNTQSYLQTYVPHNQSIRKLEDGNNSYAVTANWFKVVPEDLDTLFVVKTPKDHTLDFFQFYGNYRISLAIVAGMSVHGQPSL